MLDKNIVYDRKAALKNAGVMLKIDIDSLITHKLSLEDINKGFDLMHAGESIRAVVEY